MFGKSRRLALLDIRWRAVPAQRDGALDEYAATMRLPAAKREPYLREAHGQANHLRLILWLDQEFSSSKRDARSYGNYQCACQALIGLERLLEETDPEARGGCLERQAQPESLPSGLALHHW